MLAITGRKAVIMRNNIYGNKRVNEKIGRLKKIMKQYAVAFELKKSFAKVRFPHSWAGYFIFIFI